MKSLFGVLFGAYLICHICSLKIERDRGDHIDHLSGQGGQNRALHGGSRGKTSRNRNADATAKPKKTLIFYTNEPYRGLPQAVSLLNSEHYARWTKWSKCDMHDCIQFRHRKCLDRTYEEGKLASFGKSGCSSTYVMETRECKNKTACLSSNKMSNCGDRPNSVGIMSKIVGGEISKPNAWPWMVRLSKGLDTGNATHICGGTLLAPQWILTAAQCITGDKTLTESDLSNGIDGIYAHLGDHRASVSENTQRDYLVNLAIIHPSFTPGSVIRGNDIALLYLKEPVEIVPEVNFACLPNAPVNWNSNSNAKCYAVGWGKTHANSEENIFQYIWGLFSRWSETNPKPNVHQPSQSDGMSNELQEVRLPILSDDDCAVHYPGLQEGEYICAGTKEKNTCNGDSGGGLYCQLPNSNKWVIAGVTSFRDKDGCGRRPGVYTSVPANERWIFRTITDFHFAIKTALFLNIKYEDEED